MRRLTLPALLASALLTAAALAVPTPAQAVGRCPATVSGFVIAGGPYGASGVDDGKLVKVEPRDVGYSTCSYRGPYWTIAVGGSKVYNGRFCTWMRDLRVPNLGSPYGVTCS
jgi:hypothetical protein